MNLLASDSPLYCVYIYTHTHYKVNPQELNDSIKESKILNSFLEVNIL
jgi:hypothetical protein